MAAAWCNNRPVHSNKTGKCTESVLGNNRSGSTGMADAAKFRDKATIRRAAARQRLLNLAP
jgi:hypothetical protein